jgi:transporter family-2 protein
MSNNILLLFVALLAGAMMPTQAATNNKMAVVTGSPILAAFLSFLVGTVALFACVIAAGTPMTSFASIKEAPPIAWAGGLFGAFFVTAAVMLVPRIGVAMTFSALIAGQMIVTLIIDHYGLLGVPVKEISIPRVIGIVLIAVGVILIRRF